MFMKSYVLTQPRTLEFLNAPAVPVPPDCAKVRITHAALSPSDLSLYLGRTPGAAYPMIPSRQGLGIISEIEENNIYGLKRGDRVYINPYRACGECFECKTGQPRHCRNLQIMGVNTDGFLRDFAVAGLSSLIPLPEQVNEEEALFSEYISMAIEVLDSLNLEKGDHVVVVGGDTLGNILCQLCIYYQCVPVLVDRNRRNLDIAEASGVYYTVADELSAEQFVNQVTGGRRAKHLIFVPGTRADINNVVRYAAPGADLAVAGYLDAEMDLKLSPAVVRQLRVLTFCNGFNELRSALNMLVNKSVRLDGLRSGKISFKEAPALFESQAEAFERDEIFQYTVDVMAD